MTKRKRMQEKMLSRRKLKFAEEMAVLKQIDIVGLQIEINDLFEKYKKIGG